MSDFSGQIQHRRIRQGGEDIYHIAGGKDGQKGTKVIGAVKCEQREEESTIYGKAGCFPTAQMIIAFRNDLSGGASGPG